MKINEVILTEEQLEELNLKGLGTGIGKAIGGVAGGVVQGAKNVWTGMKQGYSGAQKALAPDNGTGTPQPTSASNAADPADSGTTPASGEPAATASTAQAPAAAPAGAPPAQADAEPPATPAVEKQSKIGVGQINKIVPTLRTRDLQSVKKTVDDTIAKKATTKPAAAPAQQSAAAKKSAQPAAPKNNVLKLPGKAAPGAVATTSNQQVGTPSATGGDTLQTPTGQIHKGNPNNPNVKAQRGAANEGFQSRFLGMEI